MLADMMLGADSLGTVPLGAGADPRIDEAGTLTAILPPVTLPATVTLPPAMEFDVRRHRAPLDRQEFGNEMAAAVFGGWLAGTVGRTPGTALLGGLAGWLGYRRISQRDRG